LIVFLLFAVALLAPHISPYDPGAINIKIVLQEPSPEHLFGTDALGRDVLSRMIWGSRISLLVGFVAMGIASLIGVFLGALAGYYGRWVEMLGDEIKGSAEILLKLKSDGMPLYALTNWSHEAFPVALERYGFMKQFDGIVVSGYEKLLKPDHAIYRVLMERYRINPAESVYIDDNKHNADAAAELGFHAIHFVSSEQLGQELRSLGLKV